MMMQMQMQQESREYNTLSNVIKAEHDTVDVVEEVLNLIWGQDDGELFIQAGARKVVSVPGHFQGDQIQELDGGDEGIDGLRRELALLGEMELVLTDGFEVELGGIAAEIFGEFGDIMDIAALRGEREVAQLHVIDETLTKRCHATAPWILDWSLGNNRIHCFKEPRATPGGCPVADDYREAV